MSIHEEIEAELARALAKYPDCESLPNGTGASGYKTFETIARLSCERAYREGRITHAHIFEEEAAEVLAAGDPGAIRKELIQVAAMAVKWVRDIDRKASNDPPPASSPVFSPGTAGGTQGPEGTEQTATSVTREAPAPAPDVIPDGYRLAPGWRLAPPQTFFRGPCPGPRAWAVFASKDFVYCVACAPSMRALEFAESACQGTSGETEPHATDRTSSAKRPHGTESADVVDPCEAEDPGNGQRNTADPSASGATDQKPAGRSTDTGASVSRDARPAAGGAAVAAPQAEVPVCCYPNADFPASLCERPHGHADSHKMVLPDGRWPTWYSHERHAALLSPASEVQPVPAGYRLGAGWKMSGYQGRSECFCAASALFFVKPPSAAISALCPAHAAEMGALVPIEPTAAPDFTLDRESFDEVIERIKNPALPTQALMDIMQPSANPRIYPCADCGTMRSTPEGGTTFTVCDECWDKRYPKPTAAPEGQQGEAKASGDPADVRCDFCEAEAGMLCRDTDGRTRNYHRARIATADAQPSAPAKVSEPGKVPLSQAMLTDLSPVEASELVAALEAELAEAKRERIGNVRLLDEAQAERDAARAEAEQLRAKLAEQVKKYWRWVGGEAAKARQEGRDDGEAAMRAEFERKYAEVRKQAEAEVGAALETGRGMRTAAAKVARAWIHPFGAGSRDCQQCITATSIAEAIERLPLSTGKSTPVDAAAAYRQGWTDGAKATREAHRKALLGIGRHIVPWDAHGGHCDVMRTDDVHATWKLPLPIPPDEPPTGTASAAEVGCPACGFVSAAAIAEAARQADAIKAAVTRVIEIAESSYDLDEAGFRARDHLVRRMRRICFGHSGTKNDPIPEGAPYLAPAPGMVTK